MLAIPLVNGYQTTYFEDLREGMSGEYRRFVTQRDIDLFAELTGDRNPVHIDEEYAQNTVFKGRIAHGILTASFISTVLGTRMPGPGCIYISQSLKFKSVMRAGDEVVATAKVLELYPSKYQASFDTVCMVGSRVLVDGKAIIKVPSREKQQTIK